MERGQCKPILVIAEDVNGQSDRFVVKTLAGFGDRVEGPAIDCLGTLLARAFGLLAPEPALVELTDAVAYGASDYPAHEKLIKSSLGWNYATRFLGEDWKPWTTDIRPQSISNDSMESVFAFDGMIQNTDRRPDNPNMKWKGDQLAIFDHEKTLAYVRKFAGSPRPWRDFLALRVQENHCLVDFARRQSTAKGTGFAKNFWEEVEEAKLDGEIGNAFKILESAADDLKIDLQPFCDYIDNVSAGMEDFLAYLAASL